MNLCFAMLVPETYASAEKGKVIFEENCVECHGERGDGRGAVGPYLEEQRPADLLAEKTRARSNKELFEIIQYGVHFEMPGWEGVLSDQEIVNVVKYLRALASASLPAGE
ncbi:c-type cytochrome [Candidatus Nitrospira salsa]|nr:MAG: hypothetical protein NPIRA04_02360 [Nitrospirales bacterium]